MTEDERESIINEAVERAYLGIPELVGNLMAQQSALGEINRDFYKDHPEFKDHKNSVMSVVEKIEGENPLLDYKDILKKAVPEIKQRIKTVGKLDTSSVPDRLPDRGFKSLDIPEAQRPNGII